MSVELERGFTTSDRNWTSLYPIIFRRVEIPAGSILDLGSNNCRFERWLREEKIKRDVVSLDIRNIVPSDNLTFVRGTARTLPFKDDSFDNTVSFYALPQHCHDETSERLVLQEMLRVTRCKLIIWPFPSRLMGEIIEGRSDIDFETSINLWTNFKVNRAILKKTKLLVGDYKVRIKIAGISQREVYKEHPSWNVFFGIELLKILVLEKASNQ